MVSAWNMKNFTGILTDSQKETQAERSASIFLKGPTCGMVLPDGEEGGITIESRCGMRFLTDHSQVSSGYTSPKELLKVHYKRVLLLLFHH